MAQRPVPAGADVVESTAPRGRAPRVALAVALLVAVAAVAVARRDETPPPPPPPRQPFVPVLHGWTPAGPRAHDEALRAEAWRIWSGHDISLRLERTAVLLAADWPEADRTVVVLSNDQTPNVRVAVVVVGGAAGIRYSTWSLGTGHHYVTEVVEAGGRTALVAVARGARSAVVTTARVGGRRARDATVSLTGGALVPVARGWTPTRVRLRDAAGRLLADRTPGADGSAADLPPLPLIPSERVQGDRRVQRRGNAAGVRCDVVLAEPETETPMNVLCEGTP